jgi:transcription elongation factor GreA
MSTVKISKQKLEELQAELAACLSSRPEIIERVSSARELGDLKENAEYHSAREEQRANESKIEEIEKVLKNYELVEGLNSSEVEVGAMVKLSSAEASEDEKIFTVVSSVEADPLNGKISDESPVGQALIGKKVGDEVEIGGKKYKVESIS